MYYLYISSKSSPTEENKIAAHLSYIFFETDIINTRSLERSCEDKVETQAIVDRKRKEKATRYYHSQQGSKRQGTRIPEVEIFVLLPIGQMPSQCL